MPTFDRWRPQCGLYSGAEPDWNAERQVRRATAVIGLPRRLV